MPFGFPSHQGLILPIWTRWPERFNGLALSVGAAVPDIVDALAWPFRGRLGQWLGHSLAGLVPLCLPAGLVITVLLRAVGRRRAPTSALRILDGEGSAPEESRGGILRLSLSVLLGAASHLVFDLVSHPGFVLLLPWYERKDLFPPWWSHTWASVPLPVYREPYPIAPHFVVWAALSIAGAVMYLRIVRSARRAGTGTILSGRASGKPGRPGAES